VFIHKTANFDPNHYPCLMGAKISYVYLPGLASIALRVVQLRLGCHGEGFRQTWSSGLYDGDLTWLTGSDHMIAWVFILPRTWSCTGAWALAELHAIWL
jgi:hypothetical protein